MKKYAALGAALWLAAAGLAAGQQAAPLPVPRLGSSPVLDGRLDDPVWADAVRLELEFETDPGENIPALVRTEVLVFHDKDNLYFGLNCYDPDPSAIRARYADRDAIFNDDIININLDTFNDQRRNYFFGCNALGLQRDGIEAASGAGPWDAIWKSAGKITEFGYCVEVAIPFASIQFQRTDGPQTWGLDVSRWYQRSQRHRLGLVKIDRNNNSYQSQFLKITGFAGIKPGRNVEAMPTLTGTWTEARESFPGGAFAPVSKKVDPGLTVKWGLTPNLTLNGTVNPDFSQVEADARQLDINQPFALFYQEKRPFFLEGTDFFLSPMSVVYTRTIRDPTWGFKLSGKEGVHTVGAYVAQDDLTNLIFPGSQGSRSSSLDQSCLAGVFRYKLDLGSRYTIGAVVTGREGTDYFNRVVGVDGLARFTGRNLVEFQYLASNTRYPEAVAQDFGQPLQAFWDHALRIGYRNQSRSLNAYAQYQDIGSGFRADLGYMPRVDYSSFNGGVDYGWIFAGRFCSELRFGYGYVSGRTQDRQFLGSTHEVTMFFRGALQSYLQLVGWLSREAYGSQVFDEEAIALYFSFQPRAELQFGLSGGFGDMIDYASARLGRRVSLDPALTYHLGRRTTLTLDHAYEKMDVAGQALYTANISQGSVVYHFSSRLFLRAILQYLNYAQNPSNYPFPVDPKTRQLFGQFLLSYKLNPRTVAFLGYSNNYHGMQDVRLTVTDWTLFLKFGYSWQF